jgi:hypothetical protein
MIRPRLIGLFLLALVVFLSVSCQAISANPWGGEYTETIDAPLDVPDNPTDAGEVFYVDGAVAVSGDGTSRTAAFKTVQEGLDAIDSAGDQVWIAPGLYPEYVAVRTGGVPVSEIVTGVSVETVGGRSGVGIVTFPTGTDLSGVTAGVNSHRGEYFLYLYRSALGNNGVFPVTEVNSVGGTVTVDTSALRDGLFVSEAGKVDDTYGLTAVVGRPVRIRRDPEAGSGSVVLNVYSNPEGFTIFYIGRYLDPYDALPTDFVMVEDLELTGSREGGGVHLQSSSFSLLSGLLIHDTGTESLVGAGGVIINGNADRPARYNVVSRCEIYNTPWEGIYNGAGGHPEYNNHAHFTHILGNTIYTTGSAAHAVLENAVDLKEYNRGAVVAGNTIGRVEEVTGLDSSYNGLIDVREKTEGTMVYANILQNLESRTGADNPVDQNPVYGINVYGGTRNVEVYNNLIVHAPTAGFWAIRVEDKFAGSGASSTGILVAYNTLYNVAGGLFLEEYGGSGVVVCGNIICIADDDPEAPIKSYRETFVLSDNLYSINPSAYAGELGRLVVMDMGLVNPEISLWKPTDFQPSGTSVAVDSGPVLPDGSRGTVGIALDILGRPRDMVPDRGALEFIW